MTRSISSSRPMTGSISPFLASSVRSRPNAVSAGVFTSFLSGCRFGSALRFLLLFLRRKIRVEFLEDFIARALDVDLEVLQHARGHAFAFAQQAEQDVLGADVGMVERLRFLAREREHLLHARRVGNVPDHLGLGPDADLLLDFHADGLEIEAHLLEHVDGDALAQLDQAEQEMLGADVVVVEAVGFLAGERQHLLCARREVIHHFPEFPRVLW